MACYSIDGQDTNTAGTSILGLTGSASIRAKVYWLELGSDAAPADNAAEYVLQRYTAAGTATAVTPQKLDPGSAAATCTAGEAHSAEPTYTADAILLAFMLNQKATFQWYASPGRELISALAANNGIGLQVITASATANVGTCWHFEE